jgi:hemerythrin superfamily protein
MRQKCYVITKRLTDHPEKEETSVFPANINVF